MYLSYNKNLKKRELYVANSQIFKNHWNELSRIQEKLKNYKSWNSQ